MKKNYEAPFLEIARLSFEKMIMASGDDIEEDELATNAGGYMPDDD